MMIAVDLELIWNGVRLDDPAVTDDESYAGYLLTTRVNVKDESFGADRTRSIEIGKQSLVSVGCINVHSQSKLAA